MKWKYVPWIMTLFWGGGGGVGFIVGVLVSRQASMVLDVSFTTGETVGDAATKIVCLYRGKMVN